MKCSNYSRSWRCQREARPNSTRCEECAASHRKHVKICRDKNRAKAHAKLGNKCANPDCRWLNEDGTLGCTDSRILQIDHKFGGGTKELATLAENVYIKKVLADTTGAYQLLCSNCNWIKKCERKEVPEGPDHPSWLNVRLELSMAKRRPLE